MKAGAEGRSVVKVDANQNSDLRMSGDRMAADPKLASCAQAEDRKEVLKAAEQNG